MKEAVPMSEPRTSEKTGKPLPRCKAILLCERTIREAETGKWSLIGIIHKLVFPRLPATTQPMTAYAEFDPGEAIDCEWQVLVNVPKRASLSFPLAAGTIR
jgi:hypothetical protein